MGIVKEYYLEKEISRHNKYYADTIIDYPRRKEEELWKTCPCEYCKARRKENNQ